MNRRFYKSSLICKTCDELVLHKKKKPKYKCGDTLCFPWQDFLVLSVWILRWVLAGTSEICGFNSCVSYVWTEGKSDYLGWHSVSTFLKWCNWEKMNSFIILLSVYSISPLNTQLMNERENVRCKNCYTLAYETWNKNEYIWNYSVRSCW